MLKPIVIVLLIILGTGFLLGFIKWSKSNIAFKTITILLLTTFIAEFTAGSMRYFGYKTNVTIYKIFDPVQVILIGFIFYHLYYSSKLKQFAVYGGCVALTLLLASTMINISPTINNAIGVTTKCAFFILLCLFKFAEMLRMPSEDNILADPSFWFCSALFFFYAVTIMYWIAYNQIALSEAKLIAHKIHVYCNYIFYTIVASSFLLIPFKKSKPLVLHE